MYPPNLSDSHHLPSLERIAYLTLSHGRLSRPISRIRLVLCLALLTPALAARFTVLRLAGDKFCIQTKDGSADLGAEIEYGECDNGSTQRWVYEDNLLKLFGTNDGCLAITKEDKVVLASCIPSDNPDIKTISWDWNPSVTGPICAYREEVPDPIIETSCLSAIGGQEPPKLFLSWVQRSVPFEPVRTRGGPGDKCDDSSK